MAVKTKDELLEIIRERIGDDTSDEAISFIEDITDTLSDFEEKAINSNTDDWKTKYEENDKMWREKYRKRFFSKDVEKEDEVFEDEDEVKSLSYEDLFEEKEEK